METRAAPRHRDEVLELVLNLDVSWGTHGRTGELPNRHSSINDHYERKSGFRTGNEPTGERSGVRYVKNNHLLKKNV